MREDDPMLRFHVSLAGCFMLACSSPVLDVDRDVIDDRGSMDERDAGAGAGAGDADARAVVPAEGRPAASPSSDLPTWLRREAFDREPGWESHDSRQRPSPCPVIAQGFGYTPPGAGRNHLESSTGEIGGRVVRSYRFAHYSKDIGEATLEEPLRADGRFRVTSVEGQTAVLFGWYDRNSPDWRKPSSLVLRLSGESGGAEYFVEYATRSRLVGGAGERAFSRELLPIKPGINYSWRMTYDPDRGHGRVILRIGSQEHGDLPTLVADLTEEQRRDGALFNRFGMTNVTRPGSGAPLEIYFDDIQLDGVPEEFGPSEDLPGWGGANNESTYEDCVAPQRHDFGYAADRQAAGGLLWRAADNPAWYADRVGRDNEAGDREPLTLQHELYASGTFYPERSTSDSGILFGWFDSTGEPGRCGGDDPTGESRGLPLGFVGIATGGISRLGERAWPVFRTHGGGGRLDIGRLPSPLLIFNGEPRSWELHYLPTVDDDGIARSGTIVFTYDGQSVELPIPPETFSAETTFDRFGIRTHDCGGANQEIYLDDLTYTVQPPERG